MAQRVLYTHTNYNDSGYISLVDDASFCNSQNAESGNVNSNSDFDFTNPYNYYVVAKLNELSSKLQRVSGANSSSAASGSSASTLTRGRRDEGVKGGVEQIGVSRSSLELSLIHI